MIAFILFILTIRIINYLNPEQPVELWVIIIGLIVVSAYAGIDIASKIANIQHKDGKNRERQS